MCGIAGRVGPITAQPVGWAAVAERLGHRGPDASTVQRWCIGTSEATLTHTRLAINDLSEAGVQPTFGESDRYALIFNGEIYNYLELRSYCEAHGHVFRSRMDGEVIVHLFEMDGIASFNRLNGVFAVALLDTYNGTLVLARDPLGVKPLFYSLNDSTGITFASEISTLAQSGAKLGKFDVTALAQFLTFLWVPSPRTPFTGASSLGPGKVLIHEPHGTSIEHYADPLYNVGQLTHLSADEAIGQCSERFAAAAQRQLLSDVPIGLMASGGIDSGLLWWATHQSLERAFTVAWEANSGEEGLHDDAANARILQRRFGTPLEEVRLEATDFALLPPAGDLIADPAYLLSSAIAKRSRAAGIKVLLSGQGGDEVFGGYRRHLVARYLERVTIGRAGLRTADALGRLGRSGIRTEYSARILRAFAERDPFDGYMQLCSYSTSRERARVLGTYEYEVADNVVWASHREAYDGLPPDMGFSRRARMLDLSVYMPGLGLAYVDRASMEHGVETRVPWLDLELVRWATSLPTGLLVRGKQGKWITRQVTSQELGAVYANAPKRGFGVPSAHLPLSEYAGGRGFRQGRYFALATHVLERYRGGLGRELRAQSGD